MSVQMPPIEEHSTQINQQAVIPSGSTNPPALHGELASLPEPVPSTSICATPSSSPRAGNGNEGGLPVVATEYGADSSGTTT